MSYTLNPGDVFDFDLGQPPQEVRGHEQAFNRPCIVMAAFPQLQLALVIPVTSSQPRNFSHLMVAFAKGVSGFTSDCCALCFQTRVVAYNRIIKKRGVLSDKDLNRVRITLKYTLQI